MATDRERPGGRSHINGRRPSAALPEAAKILNRIDGDVVQIDIVRKEFAVFEPRAHAIRVGGKARKRVLTVDAGLGLQILETAEKSYFRVGQWKARGVVYFAGNRDRA